MGKSVGEASYDRPDIRAYVRFKDEFDAPWTSGGLGSWRRGSESNRRIRLLQSPALPLGYPAVKGAL